MTASSAIDRRSRILGSLYGLLVGDALGLPYESLMPSELPPLHLLDMQPPAHLRRAHPGTPPGTWSDDGAQALALLEALLDAGRVDADAIGARLLAWQSDGRYTVDGSAFGCGVQSAAAIRRMERGVPAVEAGGSDEYSNGNGSLMRVAPLALWHKGTDAELIEAAHMQSLPTHAHPRSLVACALLVLLIRQLLDGVSEPNAALDGAVSVLTAHYANRPEFTDELAELLAATERHSPTGSGYVVDTLWSAMRAVRTGDFEGAVCAAIGFGNDTDTTACVTGALAGAMHGVEAIPQRWMHALRGRHIVEPLATRLL